MNRRFFLAATTAAILIRDWSSAESVAAQFSLSERDPPADRCLPVVEREIERIALPRSRIDKIQISRRLQDIRGSQRTTGFDGWVRLNDCPGSVVVDMDKNCRVRQVYARGMCAVPGVKSFD